MNIYSMGIDIGSLTVKVVLLSEEHEVLYSTYKAHKGSPVNRIKEIFDEIMESDYSKSRFRIGITGSGKELLSLFENAVTYVNEIVAQAVSVTEFYPEAKTIIEIGGQDSKYIKLEKKSGWKKPGIMSQKMNDICAAGNGAFIEQEATRMNVSIQTFSEYAGRSEKIANIAGRCSVFAKSDIVHLRQSGVLNEEIAAGVCHSVVRNYLAQFTKGKGVEKPIIFQGGVAANKGIERAFREKLGAWNEDLIIPAHHNVSGAVGAAVVATQELSSEGVILSDFVEKVLAPAYKLTKNNQLIKRLSPLVDKCKKVNSLDKVELQTGADYYLGVDVGSTSTCMALIDESNNLVASTYSLNRGNILESINHAFIDLIDSAGEKIHQCNINGVGVTGSGRYLVSQYIGGDVVRDEISAQAFAAVALYPEVDTIFEIGGQDSKYISIHNGRVVDFEMNKACSAGTGYFLLEQAERLDVPMVMMSDVALQSQSPCDLGSRCTVFMESDIINFQQMGISKNDIVAGLSYSIVHNYLEKVVGGKSIGKNILFLGGVALNESVGAAFKQHLQKEIIIPEYHEISAAIGMALVAKGQKGIEYDYSNFLGFQVDSEEYLQSEFICDHCSKSCKIAKVSTNKGEFMFGGSCDRYSGGETREKVPNLFRKRHKLMMSYWNKPAKKVVSNKPKVGIIRAHLFYEMFPMMATFLQELGYEVIISDETDQEIVHAGLERTEIDNCFSCKVVYGHVNNLIEKGVTDIFFPAVAEFERKVQDIQRNFSCPHIQAMPMLVKTAYEKLNIMSPRFYRDRNENDWTRELVKTGMSLGHSEAMVQDAVKKSALVMKEFREGCENIGREVLEKVSDDSDVFVLIGKVYNVCDEALNMSIAAKFAGRKKVIIPYDCLPLSDKSLSNDYRDMVWESGQDVIRAAHIILEYKNLYPIMVTNFGCGPDSFIIKYLYELFQDRSFLVLEVDEHTSDVGTLTRVEAFLNTLRQEEYLHAGNTLNNGFRPYEPQDTKLLEGKTLYIPWGFDSYKAIAVAFEAIGIKTRMLPQHTKETELFGRKYSSGRECLPYIMHAGDTVLMTQEPDFDPDKAALFMPSTDLSCRVSLFSTSIGLILDDLGYPDIPVIAPRISMDNDEVLKYYGMKFTKTLFRAMIGIELMTRLVVQIRPYEVNKGESDEIYDWALEKICATAASLKFFQTMRDVVNAFTSVEVDETRKLPVIGIVGDDYTRGNPYANKDIIKQVEELGGEARVLPIWSSFLEFQMGMKPLKTLRRRKYFEYTFDKIKSVVGKYDIQRINDIFEGKLKGFPDPNFHQMMEVAEGYCNDRSEPLIIIAMAHNLHLLKTGVDGVINLIGFQCMIHSIVSAQMRDVYAQHNNTPNLSLCYDFQEEGHKKNRVEAFMYQVMQNVEKKNKDEVLTV